MCVRNYTCGRKANKEVLNYKNINTDYGEKVFFTSRWRFGVERYP